MNELLLMQISDLAQKKKASLQNGQAKYLRLAFLILSVFCLALNVAQAEGSKDFRDDAGKRLFYWANQEQQIKVYAAEGEFLNLGASHIGLNGGYMMLYKPDGTLAGIFQDIGAAAGLGIINNDVEEMNGPTGGGTTNGAGYVPVVQEVQAGEAGIWTVVFGFPNVLPAFVNYPFTNLENNESWTRAAHQPMEWAIVSWDVTVSTAQAANAGGTMLSGRVYSNQYRGIIYQNDNVTSPTFYVLSKDGIQYQLDFDEVDAAVLNVFATSVGIINHNQQPTYLSKAGGQYVVSSDPTTWNPPFHYIYAPQYPDNESLFSQKIFFNLPDPNLPAAALTTSPFSNLTEFTWLQKMPSAEPLEIQEFQLRGVDDMGNFNCLENNLQSGLGGTVSFLANISGTVKLSLDLNEDGDYLDAEDRIIYQYATTGNNEITWDGKDGNGVNLALTNGMEIDYLLEMRLGEMHVMINDAENHTGGLAFTRLNGTNVPNRNFYYNHTEVGGSASGGGAPSAAPTDLPHAYDSNWGNNKMLDYWAYQEVAEPQSGKLVINVVNNCARPTLSDSDLDGVLDNIDLDDDNDGIPDAMEYCHLGTNSFDCFTNNLDPSGDADGDLVPNYFDADDAMVANPCNDFDANGICDAIAAIYDYDGDSVPNHLDLDADNDGIPDMVEAGHGLPDVNQDAKIDGVNTDFGANGLFNTIADNDNSDAEILYTVLNTNNNDTPDFNDLDADADGISDVLETLQTDADQDGRVGTGVLKVNGRGLVLEDGNGEAVEIIFMPRNLDMDAAPDYRDWDRDGDGISDAYECPNPQDCTDSDDDGNPDADELDSDGDGLTDSEECPGGIPCPDSNGNGVDDYQEFVCPVFDTPLVTAVDEVICAGEVLGLSVTNTFTNGEIFEWFYNDGVTGFSLGVTTSPNYFLNNTTSFNTGAYSVKVRRGACTSQVSNAINIQVHPTTAPLAINSTSETAPACAGETVQLSVPQFLEATYEWSGPNGFTSTEADPILTNLSPADAGSYFAVVEMSDGCATLISTNTTVFVQATPAPAAVSSVVNICAGNDLVLTATPVGISPSIAVNFEWFYENGTSVGTTTETDFNLPNVGTAAAGGYYVVMTVGDCTAEASTLVQVEVNPTEIPNAGNDATICGLGNGNIVATMPTSGFGQWTSPTGALIIDPQNAETSVADLTMGNNVFVWSLSNDNCENYATDTVVITYSNATNDFANAGVDFEVCEVNTLSLNALLPTTATGLWSQSNAQTQAGVLIFDNTNTNAVVQGLVAGNTYSFTWTLSEGTCADYDTDEVLITVSTTPTENATVENDEQFVCDGDEINLTATSPTQGTGKWTTTSTATISNNNNAITAAENLPMGESSFIWTLSNGACENYSAATMTVFREENVEAEDDRYLLNLNDRLVNEDVLANDYISSVSEYSVNVTREPRMGTVEMADGIFNYTPSAGAFGTDDFEYELCNVNCPDNCETATVEITLNGLNAQGECWVPNILTPNGNGKNDELIIPCTPSFPNNELTIFNRWGDEVYATKGYKNDWRGTHDGNDLPAGTYYYIFKLDDNDADPLQGFFTIVRK